MKKVVLALVLLILVQNVAAPGVGTGTGINVGIDNFAPLVWMDPNHRIIIDDPTSPGPITGPGEEMIERVNNYAFEGEQILWKVVAYHKNGKDMIDDVNVVIYNTTANMTEVSCIDITGQCMGSPTVDSCNLYDFETCSVVNGCDTGCDVVIQSPNSIQSAIDLASAGDVICVDSGTYTEPLYINKPLTLLALHSPLGIDAAVISPVSGDSFIQISSNDVIVDGFKIDGNGYIGPFYFAGIIVNTDINDADLSNIIIRNNWIRDLTVAAGYSVKGIHLHNENNGLSLRNINITVENNLIENIKGSTTGSYGIQTVDDMQNVIIRNNIIRNITSAGWSGGVAVTCQPGFVPVTTEVEMRNNDLDSMYTEPCAISSDIIFEENNVVLGIANGAAATLMAENNYWGTTNDPTIDAMTIGNIDYTPFALSAFAVEGINEPFMCYDTPGLCESFATMDSCTEVGCDWFGPQSQVEIWDGEQHFTEFDPLTMQWYQCLFTVEPRNLMHGEYLVKAVANSGLNKGTFAEHEKWFFNPEIYLGLDGEIDFGTIIPGSTAKSSPIVITNGAEQDSGVMLDMYIAGEDFYPSGSTPASCPTTNKLALTNFKYYASHGNYNTCQNTGVDVECYDEIPYFMNGNGAPPNNNYKRVIENTPTLLGEYPVGNILSPDDDLTLNFKLRLPVPCTGGPFDSGQIKFYGEAI